MVRMVYVGEGQVGGDKLNFYKKRIVHVKTKTNFDCIFFVCKSRSFH